MTEPSKTCFFTGHRTIDSKYKTQLPRDIERLCALLLNDYGVTDFIAGGALGFDTLAAQAVLRLRDSGFPAKLHLFLPCFDQTRYWNSNNIRIWNEILHRADSYKYITNGSYVPGCMHARNRAMVDAAGYGIAFCIHKEGGTFYTVNIARERGKTLFILPESPK